MWLLKAPKLYGNITGDLFEHKFVNGYCLVSKQYYWQFLTYRGFVDVTPVDWKHPKPESLERVLLVHHGGIGDVLFISVVAKAYKKMYPQVKIHLATNFVGSQLFRNNPHVDGFVIDQQQAIGHLVDQYDDVVCFDAIIAGNAGATMQNVYDLYLAWANMESDDKLPEINIPDEIKAGIQKRLAGEFGIKENDKIVVIQLDSSTAIRNIEWEKMVEIAKTIQDDGYTVLLFGASSAIKDATMVVCPKCQRKNQSLAGPSVVEMKRKCTGCGTELQIVAERDRIVGKDKRIFFLEGYSIYDIAGVISLASCLIGVDSCGLHIAGAVGTPMLGIFSSFEGDYRMRYYKKARWIQKPYRCAPCFIHHIPCRWMMEGGTSVPPCMAQITADEIYAEFKKLEKGEPFAAPAPFVPADPGKCPVCGSTQRTFLTRKGTVCYHQCQICDAVYCNAPIHTEFYQEPEYWPTYRKEIYAAGQRDLARRITATYGPGLNFTGSLLEIGCAAGDCLAELQRMGWMVKGAEISKTFQEDYVKKGLDVHVGPFEDLAPGSLYDIVLLKDVFEHFSDPVGVLRKIKEFLKPGGQVVIFSPDTDYWMKCNNKWGHINTNFPGEHSVLLNKKSLETAGANAGFLVKTFTKMDGSESFWATLTRGEK